jgi:hypothetical protein
MRNPNLILLLAAACGGGSDLDPGSGDDPGTGTRTLVVDGSAHARPRLVNARTAADFETSFEVRVMIGLQNVTGGTVSITSSRGTFPLLYSSDKNRWEGSAPGYDQVYVLDVESGADAVHDVRVDGPDVHFFTKPLPGATVDSRAILDIAWDSDDTADTASIDAEEIDQIAIPDTGTYVLAAGALKAEKDRAHENTIDLARTNRVTPAGAAPGSEFEVRVENTIQVVAQPDPTL